MLFQGFRGGPIFPGGVQMLFCIETHLTEDVPGEGGPDPIPPRDPRMLI